MDNAQSTPGPSTSSSERFVAPPFSRLNSARLLRPQPSPHPPPAGSWGPSTPRLSNSNASTPRSQACLDAGRGLNDFQGLYNLGRAEKAGASGIIRPATAAHRSPVTRGFAQLASNKLSASEGPCPRRPSSAAPFPARTPNGSSPPDAGLSNSPVPSFATSTAAQQQYDGGLHSVLSSGAAAQLRTLLLGLSSSLILMCDACQQIIDDMPRGWLYVQSTSNSPPPPSSFSSSLEGSTRMRPAAVSVLADIKYLRKASKGELMEALLQVVRDLSSGGGAAASSTQTSANSRRVLSARGPRRDIVAAKGLLFPTSSPQPQRPYAAVVRDHQTRSYLHVEAKQTPPPPPSANSGQGRPPVSPSFVLDGMLGALQHCEILILALAVLHVSATRLVADFKGQEGIPHPPIHPVNVQTLPSSSSSEKSSCWILALEEAFEKGQGFIVDIAKVIELCIVRWPVAGAAAVSSHTEANMQQSPATAPSSDSCVEAEGVLVTRGVLAEVAAAFEARRAAIVTSITMREKVYSSGSFSCATDKGSRRGGTELESHHSTFVASVRRRLSTSLPSATNAEHEDGSVERQTGNTCGSSSTKKAIAEELAKSHLSSSALDRLLPLYGNTQFKPPPPARDAGTSISGERASGDLAAFLRFSAHHTASDRAAHTYLSKRVLFLRKARYSSLLAWEETRRLFNEKRGSGVMDAAPAGTESSPSDKRDIGGTKYTNNRVRHGTGQSKGAESRRPETAGHGVERSRGFTHAARGQGTSEAAPPPSIFTPFVRGSQPRTPSAANASNARTQSFSASVNAKTAAVLLKDKHLAATIQSDARRWDTFEAVEAKDEAAETTPTNLHLPPPWPHAVLSSVASLLSMEYDAKSGALTKIINGAASPPVASTVSHDSFLRVNEYLKILQRRWHPDRFISRCAHMNEGQTMHVEEGIVCSKAKEGGREDDSSETLVAKATRISQTINALRDGLSRALFVK